MMKRLSEWYDGLRPIEDHVAAGLSPRARNNVRAAIIVIAALPGIALVESHFINRPWRDFDRVDINLPAPKMTLDVGQPWPGNTPVTLLSELLPKEVGALLPVDAAVPEGQTRLSVFSVLEPVQSLNTPVSQSWLSSLTQPDGETVTTEVAVWCGFDLEKSPAERLCMATVPLPVFGKVISATCVSANGFALYHTLLRSDICESGGHENICSRLPDWKNEPPAQGERVTIDNLQCSASMVLPYLTLTMTRDEILISSETISPLSDTFKIDVEHGPGFTRSQTLLAHQAASDGKLSWDELLDDTGAIPVTIKPQTRAAGLVWTAYRSRHDIKRGHDAKDPTLKGSVSLQEWIIPLQAPESFQFAAQFLGHQSAVAATTAYKPINAETPPFPDVCQLGNDVQTVAQDAFYRHEETGYRIRLFQSVCPEEALKSLLFP